MSPDIIWAKKKVFAHRRMNIFVLGFPNLSKTNRHHMALCEPMPIDFRHLRDKNEEVVYYSKLTYFGKGIVSVFWYAI